MFRLITDRCGFRYGPEAMARPRSEEANRAALAAAVDVLVEQGLEGITWEEIAQRSGVARSTLGRHFATREDLIEAAVRSCRVDYVTPDTGSLEDDLRFLFDFDRNTTSEEERRLEELLPLVIDAARRDPAFAEVVDDIVENRRRPLLTVLRLAQLRGELGADLPLDDAFALVIGPILFRRMVQQQPVQGAFVDRLITWVITALREPVPTAD